MTGKRVSIRPIRPRPIPAPRESQLVASVWLALLAVIGHALVIRWLEIENRKLALAKAKERRAVEAGKATGDPANPVTIEVSALDIPTINAQTRKLLRTVIAMTMVVGLWLIWSQVLPALAVLGKVALWDTLGTVDGHEVSQPAREPSAPRETRDRPHAVGAGEAPHPKNA